MKRIGRIRQRDITDCGAACIAAILQYYGSHVPVSSIRQLAGTDQRGTSILGLVQAAGSLGLQVKAIRGNPQNLPLIPVPSIVHVVLPSGLHHYQVLVKLAKRTLVVMDPADGRFHKVPYEKFVENWSGVVICLAPMADFTPTRVSIPVINRFLQLARPHRSALFQALLGAIVFTLLGFSTAIYIQKLIDDIIGQNNQGLLHVLGALMILLLVMQTIIGTIRNVIGFKTGQVMDARLITGYLRHLFNLPQQFFDTMRVGEIVSRVNDAVKIRLFVNDTLLGIVLNLLIVIFSIMLLFFYYWKMAVIVMCIFPVYWILHLFINRLNRKWQRRLMEQSADMESHFVESLQAAATVKRLGLEYYVVDKTESSFFRLMNTVYKAGMYNLYLGTTTDFFNRLLTIVVLWTGGWLVMTRELSTGELLSFYTLIGYFTGPAAWLITSGKSIQEAIISADRLFEITDLEIEQVTTGTTIDLTRENFSTIKFRGVNFRYGARALVLHDLDICFEKGSITAVVGESGSGKSTIFHLLQQVYKIKEGLITIGEIPIQHFSAASLKNLIAVVPQKVDLFTGSIAENIAIGENPPDMARVVQCCRQAGAADFIDELPEGYNSMLGEKGTSLSGGQQQKLAIARALYRDPELLIMDEATAHLDPLSENRIRQMLLERKRSGKTSILIAHRLTTVQIADQIHIIEKGKLAGSGKHGDLMISNEKYAGLWHPTQEISCCSMESGI